jgi:hypothetical protein
MGCNCGSKTRARVTYLATFSDGTQKTYNTETEAKLAVQRNGGSYRQQG